MISVKIGLVALYLLSPLAGAGGDWTHAYDSQFRDAALQEWEPSRHIFWPSLKATAACESSLRPDAVSPVGAKGLAQFMPGTWTEVVAREGWEGDPTPFDAHWAILAMAAQFEWLAIHIWTSPRPLDKEFEVVWASSNAGQGNIIKAQVLAHGARDWDDIAPELHRVTGHHSKETLRHVSCIRKEWENITGLAWFPEELQR